MSAGRPTKSHEYIFLLSKRPRYFFDQEAVKEPAAESVIARAAYKNGGTKLATNSDRNDGDKGQRTSFADHLDGRNIRSVWSVATHPYAEAHFATFPPDLAERCIKAGTSEKGACAACGAPWVRVVEKGEPFDPSAYGYRSTSKSDPGMMRNDATEAPSLSNGQEWGRWKAAHPDTTTGWQPSCQCSADVTPCVALDPFAGAGTVSLVAERLGRDSIGVELNSDYVSMAEKRIRADCPMFATVETIR